MKKLFQIIVLSFLMLFNLIGSLTLAQTSDNKYLLIKELSSEFLKNNNSLLQGIIILLVILIFGYSAKLFYEKKFGKE